MKAIQSLAAFGLLISSSAISATSIFELQHEPKNKGNRYELFQTSKDQWQLTFDNGKEPIKKVSVVKPEANELEVTIRRLVWKSKYKTKAKECTVYASAKMKDESAKICLEDKSTTGQTMGLLNRLSEKFK